MTTRTPIKPASSTQKWHRQTHTLVCARTRVHSSARQSENTRLAQKVRAAPVAASQIDLFSSTWKL